MRAPRCAARKRTGDSSTRSISLRACPAPALACARQRFTARAERDEQIPIADAGRACGHTGRGSRDSGRGTAARLFQLQLALEHLLHQDDAAARRVHLLTEHAVRGARGQTEPAMHAGLSGSRHGRAVRAERVEWDRCCISRASPPKHLPRGSSVRRTRPSKTFQCGRARATAVSAARSRPRRQPQLQGSAVLRLDPRPPVVASSDGRRRRR